MPAKAWALFRNAVASAFLLYWLHLHNGLRDWLGSDGFHLATPASPLFRPLPHPFPELLWWSVFAGSLMLYLKRSAPWGCLIVGAGFFYATMCDWASFGALNMHFLFSFAVIFWSLGLHVSKSGSMSAWPAFLIRIYLVVVYFGSGWRKAVYGNWINDPHALLHCLSGYYVTDVVRWLYPIVPHFTWTLVQYMSIGFELGSPLLLLVPAFRKWGALWGCLLHLGIALFMKDLVFFSLQMLTFYIPLLTPTSLALTTPRRDCPPSKVI